MGHFTSGESIFELKEEHLRTYHARDEGAGLVELGDFVELFVRDQLVKDFWVPVRGLCRLCSFVFRHLSREFLEHFGQPPDRQARGVATQERSQELRELRLQ